VSGNTPDAVLKLGGSLCRRAASLKRLVTALAALSRRRTLVVVPGGGAFADAVRRADRRFALGASSSHRMAILAMDQTAYLVCDLSRRTAMVRAAREIQAGRLNVLAPSAWMLREDALPHCWDVTSDSIAAWVAWKLRARRLVLLKSVDGVFGERRAGRRSRHLVARVSSQELGDLVDGYFARALTPGIDCWIVNGSRPERVAALLATGSTYGTEVRATAAERPVGPRAAAGGDRRRAGGSPDP
jgi:aspartokinase-like uncharacterized kinase